MAFGEAAKTDDVVERAELVDFGVSLHKARIAHFACIQNLVCPSFSVGAFYFGSFVPSSRNITNGVESLHGRKNDWWGGVVDFYGREPGVPRDTRRWDGDWSQLKPAIGYYNQESPSTLRKHINQAADAGLTFFSFYWYWSREKDGDRLPEALRSFLAANESGRLKFNLSLYAHPWDEDMAIDEVNRARVYGALVRYFSHPQYLRLADGRPVFVIGDHRNIRQRGSLQCSAVDCFVDALGNFISGLRAATKAALGVEPFVQVQAGAPGWDRIQGTDGITCHLPPLAVRAATPYPALAPGVFNPLRKEGKPVSPCMFQNFDERPRQDVLIRDRSVIRYFVGKTDALFRGNLEAARAFSDQEFRRTGQEAARIVYLYAWNEWHEGGILEPNVLTGSRDLDIVSEVFGLPRKASICLDKGICD